MSQYHREWCPGGTYFFTHVLRQRHHSDLLVRYIDQLRAAVRTVRAEHPFRIHGWVVLPDHLHCVIELPDGDADFDLRWRLIKLIFSRDLPLQEKRFALNHTRRERGVWQRRYWEHLIRDEADLRANLDYLHFNPVKHGLVERVVDWPYSTFHREVRSGVYPADWGGGSSLAAVVYDD
jgi:putative transposase